MKNAAGTVLTSGTDYTLTFSSGCKSPGSYTVTVTGKGDYDGTVKKTFTIAPQPVDASRITLSPASLVYNGMVQHPEVTIKNASGKVMKPEIQYTVSYPSNSKAPGTYTVTVTGVGYYTGTATKTFTIEQQPIDASRVTLSATSFTYNGNVQKPTVTVRNSVGTVMKPEIQYTVAYSAGCKAKGTYTVTVTGTGYYTGTVKKTFTIK